MNKLSVRKPIPFYVPSKRRVVAGREGKGFAKLLLLHIRSIIQHLPTKNVLTLASKNEIP